MSDSPFRIEETFYIHFSECYSRFIQSFSWNSFPGKNGFSNVAIIALPNIDRNFLPNLSFKVENFLLCTALKKLNPIMGLPLCFISWKLFFFYIVCFVLLFSQPQIFTYVLGFHFFSSNQITASLVFIRLT